MAAPGALCCEAFPEFDQSRVDSELEDCEYPPARLHFELGESIYVPGIQHKRLLANGIGTDAKRKTNVSVVQVVRRADADVLYIFVPVRSAQLLQVSVEALELGEEGGVRKIAVEDTYGVVRIHGCYKAVASVADGFEVARSHVAGGAG